MPLLQPLEPIPVSASLPSITEPLASLAAALLLSCYETFVRSAAIFSLEAFILNNATSPQEIQMSKKLLAIATAAIFSIGIAAAQSSGTASSGSGQSGASGQSGSGTTGSSSGGASTGSSSGADMSGQTGSGSTGSTASGTSGTGSDQNSSTDTSTGKKKH